MIRRTRELAVAAFLLAMGVGEQTSRAADPDATDQRGPTGEASGLGVADTTGAAWSNQLVSVDRTTGNASSSFRLEIPPARGGVQPRLALQYNSAAGDGDVGAGWSLGVPSITRRSPSGLVRPTYFDPPHGTAIDPKYEDRFYFSGEPLVPVCTFTSDGGLCPAMDKGGEGGRAPTMVGAGWHYYRLQVENGDSPRFFWSSDHLTWVVQDKNGLIMELGQALDRNYDAASAIDMDVLKTGSIPYRWNLARHYDAMRTQGGAPMNPVVYVWSNGVLSDLFYTPPPRTAYPPLSAYAHHAHFEYEGYEFPRASPPTWRRVASSRLVRVDVTSAPFAATTGRELVRRYHLAYVTDGHHSYLDTFQMEGRCASPVSENASGLLAATSCARLPATRMQYESGSVASRFTAVTMTGLGAPTDGWLLSDVDADGLPDLVEPSIDTQRLNVFLSGYSGAPNSLVFFPSRVIPQPTTNAADILPGRPRVIAGDFTGNAAPNLLWFAPPPLNFNPRTWYADILSPSRSTTGIDFGVVASHAWPYFNGCSDYWSATGDIDSDGLADLLVSRNCNEGEGATTTSSVTGVMMTRKLQDGTIEPLGIPTSGFLPDLVLNAQCDTFSAQDPHSIQQPWVVAQWASYKRAKDKHPDVVPAFWLQDLNGDGLQDIAIVDTGVVHTYLGRGDGWFGDTCQVQGDHLVCACENYSSHDMPYYAPAIPDIHQTRYYFHDVTGDGLSDLIVPAAGGIDVYVNRHGERFEILNLHIDAASIPYWDPAAPLAFADMNASGTDDIVVGTRVVSYFDLLDGRRPGLLKSVVGGMGSTTNVDYSTIASLSLAARASNRRWAAESPQSLHVVTKVTVANGLTGQRALISSVQYEYADPVYDARERVFRGFEFARATRSGDAAAGAVTTETHSLIGKCPIQVGRPCTQGIDNPYQSFRGQPVLTEVRSQNGRYLSTVHNQYQLRGLVPGMDGRFIRKAFVEQSDTWLYDGATEPGTANVVDIDSTDNAALSQKSVITIHSRVGMQHLRQTRDQDDAGNELQRVDWGRIEGGPPDTPILTTSRWQVYGDWAWRATNVQISYAANGASPIGQIRQTLLDYYTTGQIKSVSGVLTGTAPLQRFHESGLRTADVPGTASHDGLVLLASYEIDDIGNLRRVVGASHRCLTQSFDTRFEQLRTTSTAFAGNVGPGQACGADALTTTYFYDRGLAKVTSVTSPSAAVSAITYDSFGRVSASFEPDERLPNLSSATASVLYDYAVTPTGPRVHAQVLSSRRVTSNGWQGTYQNVYSYSDSLGNELVTLMEADPSAGDGGHWTVAGVVDRSPTGLVLGRYQPEFYDGDPTTYDVARTPAAPRNSFTYDSFRRPFEAKGPDGALRGRVYLHPLSRDIWDGEDLRAGGPHQSTPSHIEYDGHGRAIEVRALIGGSSPDAIATKSTYLATGEPDSITRTHTAGDTFVRTMTYDLLGRLVTNVEPNSSAFAPDPITGGPTLLTWHYAYDDASRLVGTSDARGCGKNLHYDGAGRLIAEDFSPCLAAQEPYSTADLTSGDGTEAFYQYTPGNDPGSAPAAHGRLRRTSDRGALTELEYDGRGRVVRTTRRMAAPGMPAIALANRYSSHVFEQRATYDASDRLTSQTTGADVAALMATVGANRRESTVRTGYSRRGFPSAIDSSYGPLVPRMTYAADGLPTRAEYGDRAGTAATFDYTTMRELREVAVQRTAPALWANGASGYTKPNRDESAQHVLEHIRLTYDLVSNPTHLEDLRDGSPTGEWGQSGAKPVTRDITYDDLYRVTDVANSYAGGTDSFAAPLAGVPGAVPMLAPVSRATRQSFRYDFLGNTTSTADDASAFFDRSLGTVVNGPGTANRLTVAGPGIDPSADPIGSAGDFVRATYDNAGNTTELIVQRTIGPCPSHECTQRFVYDWDEVGRIARARRWDFSGQYPASEPRYPHLPSRAAAADLSFAYDATGQRVLKTAASAGVDAHSLYVFGSLELRHARWIAPDYERTQDTERVYLASGSTALGRIVHDTTLPQAPLRPGRYDAGTHVFLEIGDRLGSTTNVVDLDTSELVERSSYLAYGAADSDYRPARWNHFREDYRFTGKEDDVETGLTYFGARYYSAPLGRWLSPDPLTIHAGGADLNPYAYVHGSPLAAVDPFGLSEPSPLEEDAGTPPATVTQNPDGSQQIAFEETLIPAHIDVDWVYDQVDKDALAEHIAKLRDLSVTFSLERFGNSLWNIAVEKTATVIAASLTAGVPVPLFTSYVANKIAAPFQIDTGKTYDPKTNTLDLSGAAAHGTWMAAEIAATAGVAGIAMGARAGLEGAAGGVEGIALQEGQGAARGMQAHHIFPQEMAAQFEKAGINIEAFRVQLSEGTHLGQLHGSGGIPGVGPGGLWNEAWRQYLAGEAAAGRALTPGGLLQQGAQMLGDFGVPYYTPVPGFVR